MKKPTGEEQESLVSISDPRVLAIPIQENGEPLVDLVNYPQLKVTYASGGRDPGDPKTFARLREMVVRKLLVAQSLLPPGTWLIIKEGYRPPSLQRQYFEKYREELRNRYPDLTEKELYEKTCLYVAPPDNAPPHTTGGAVDLTLGNFAREGSGELDMGTDVNATPEESQNGCFTHAQNIAEDVKANRRLLISVMEAVGFVNYPSEWWHWSYGDRYWAYHRKQLCAIYDSL